MEERINIGNSATEVVTALSEYGDFSADMSATEFVGEVNTAFPDAEASVNDSATTLVGKINNADVPDDDMKVLKFLHVSDTHNCDDSITEAVAQMQADEDILAYIHTGDIVMGMIYKIAQQKAVLKPLSVIGNHDAADASTYYAGYNRDVVAMRSGMATINTDVEWGNRTPKTEGGTDYYGCYWSKDYWVDEKHTKRLRIIGLDLYNYTDEFYTGAKYGNVISQDQMDWFVGRLTSLGKNDYFIICMHDAPWGCTSAFRRKNDWCSSRLYNWANVANGPARFIPNVVRAYTQGIDTNASPISTSPYQGAGTATVKTDFSQYPPATFLCYLCGHEHGDYHYYLPYDTFADQLLFCIDTSQRSSGGDLSDIALSDTYNGTDRGSGSGYLRNCISSNPGKGILMNLVTLDFTRKTITLSRIGQYKTFEHDTSKGFNGDSNDPNGQSHTYSAVERTTITFPFKKTQS